MAPRGNVIAQPVPVGQFWIPCEYQHSDRYGFYILSIGDVDAPARGVESRYINKTLPEAVTDVLCRIGGNRRITVLTPSPPKAFADWPYRQMLRQQLLAELCIASGGPDACD